ncbi:uncharacterized protein LOC111335334 [Stylophora pistillata]|uniref:uncharacterized protein LOC111335334 n=1 Tax=Stylophora pistillata TaxID=50429 RepID=UPI000C056B92|nr:uncharacterized protein LOC111335334 [Stylophora pistillata]
MVSIRECVAPLGMETHRIKDAQITASSEWDGNHAAIQGRLNFKAGRGKQGGWSARWNNRNQWIQVALGSYTKLTSIATQGRNAHNQWVTAYKLQYSDDGVNFYYYKSPGQSSPMILKGNRDRDSVVYHKLNPPINARYIRLRPTAWYRHISLRMELYGCQECSEPLGMEGWQIKDAQITASSEWDRNHAAIQGRLNFKAGGGKQGGWSARQNNGNQWIQVALGSYTKLTSIATQGRNAHNQWVTAYKLQYSKDGVNFYYYKVPGQSSPKVFKGNKNRDSIVYHKLNPPIKARYIKLRPTAWYGHISLRMELYGCSAASGINVLCDDKNMTIVIPKFLIRGLDPKNLRLLDTKCKGKEGRTHLTVTTPLTGCKTTSRYTPTAIIYSNTLEIPAAANSAVTRVRDIKVQFSCYYSTHGVVSSLGWKPINTTLEFHDMAAKGNLKLSLRMFHSKRFVKPYLKNDFPVAVRLHRRLFFEVSTATNDKKLSIRADQCYATPTQDQKNSLKYEFIKKGCPSDVTVKYHSAPSSNAQRFSVEAFKFIAAHPFVFVHCHVTVCSATDPRSKCSMKCPLSGRGKRELSDSVTYDVHSLVQGPLHLAHEKRKENHGTILDETGSQSRLSGGSVR